ncbi:DUF2730 domain-containing protein [Pseudomonas leptonychotis]|uniref:DUF2730 domain-containing protein n=1 Tax=Pseudomonas leptonychotis TaxID=2448482 RepID=UPI00386B2ED7
MNFEQLNFGFGAMQWLITVAIGVYSWFMSRQAASTQELLELRTRIVALEEQARHLPSQTSITGLLVSLEAVRSDLGGMKNTIGGVQRSVENINAYLLQEKSRA